MTACRLVFVALALLGLPAAAFAQRGPGRPIGKVTAIGNLIHLELEPGAVVPARPFDLDRRTLRFTPDGEGYRVENVELNWDADFGPQFEGNRATLRNFRFPFSGRSWDAFNVAIGAVTFTEAPASTGGAAVGNRAGGAGSAGFGFQMERYARMRTVGSTFINMVPGVAAFVKPRLNGQRFMKELPDRVVVTWTLSEPSTGIQAFSWVPTVNRIQAVLHSNGTIELSYNDVTARDAIVGVFPMVTGGVEKALARVADAEDAAVAGHLDVKNVTLTAIDGVFVQATIETREATLPPDDPRANGVTYRIAFARDAMPADLSRGTVVWTIRGGPAGRGGGPGRAGGPGGTTRYTAAGAGVQPQVTVSGNTISVRGLLPVALSGVMSLNVAADAGTGTPVSVADQVAPTQVSLAGVHSPEMDLSAARRSEGPFAVAYEGFHWSESPRAQDVACSVITALGDKFDFIASYSDFRVDDPEGGTPSTGPRGGDVTGIGTNTGDGGAFCSQGRLQFMFAQPVSTSAVQIQERSPDGRMSDYNYAVSQIAHELGHRWAASASALLNGERVPLGPTHWGAGVHLPAAFPYGRSYEADIMGGSTWQENPDGTFTQLDRDYYNPAKGWSWLALYLMGLARPDEVPPFFMLRNLQRTGQTDAEGRPIFRGDKTVITINDVIAAMGPRTPAFENSQKQFNTAVVVITEPGKQPTRELLTAANNIAQKYIDYWAKTTGGRSTMTVNQR
jgi:hypothetical protein